MWERYGFYVVQTLLALYLSLHFKWPDNKIYPLVGSFTALNYISPIVGGWIADRLLGQKRTILCGTVILFISYLCLSFIHSNEMFLLMLAGIAVGTGLLKPNISSLLGNEYPANASNRESGFTIFYMGISSGIILGTTIPSYINQLFGWSTTFLSAAVGMLFAFIIFSFGIYRYRMTDYYVYKAQFKHILYAIILVIILWLSSFYILNDPVLANDVFIAVVLVSLTYLVITVMRETPHQRKHTIIIGLLCLISVMFWAFYFQMFLSLTLLLKRIAQPCLLGIDFPPPYYVAIQSLGMIIFGSLLAHRKRNSTVTEQSVLIGNKFLLAMGLMCVAYLLIVLSCQIGAPNALISPWRIIPAYLFISIAELLLSPVGLAAITMLASHKKVSTMMGIFFVSLGLGGFLSGKLAAYTSLAKQQTKLMSISELKIHYMISFKHLFYWLLIATLICVLLNQIIRRLIFYRVELRSS